MNAKGYVIAAQTLILQEVLLTVLLALNETYQRGPAIQEILDPRLGILPICDLKSDHLGVNSSDLSKSLTLIATWCDPADLDHNFILFSTFRFLNTEYSEYPAATARAAALS